MTMLTCPSASRLLQAYHDEELAVSEQIAVSAHLDQCIECREALDELDSLGSAIRSVAGQQRTARSAEEDRAFQRGVVARMTAEESLSLTTRVRELFDDMRLVYASLGSAAAAVACALMMFNMMRYVTVDQHPESLAAKVSMLASLELTPSPAPPIATPYVDARLLSASSLATSTDAPFAVDFEDDLVFDNVEAELAIANVISKDGSVVNVELVHAASGQPVDLGNESAEFRRTFRKLMGEMAKAHYAPATVGGLPVSVNKVWLVAHTTVHGRKEPDRVNEPTAIRGKKRLTAGTGRARRLSTV